MKINDIYENFQNSVFSLSFGNFFITIDNDFKTVYNIIFDFV